MFIVSYCTNFKDLLFNLSISENSPNKILKYYIKLYNYSVKLIIKAVRKLFLTLIIKVKTDWITKLKSNYLKARS